MTRPEIASVPDRAAFDALIASATNYERMPEFHAGRVRVDLTRMREYVARLGHPERAPAVVHVTGTKGKGSTSALVARILSVTEGSTGLHTSPHLHRMEERVMVDFEPIAENDLLDATNRVLSACRAEPAIDFPTYFEFMTLVAFLRFESARCAFAVHEVGMGGTLDATNVVVPEATAITNVALEHVAILGDTVAKIAVEKAGIVKPGVPVVTGAAGEALDPITRAADRNAAPLRILDRDFSVRSCEPTERGLRATIATWSGEYRGVEIDLMGRHQADNLAIALAVIDSLRERGRVRADRAAIVASLAGFRVPCRMETVARHPWTVVDGAHTPESVSAAVSTFSEALAGRVHGKRVALVGVARDKDLARVAAALSGFDLVIATGYGHERQTAPDAIERSIREAGGRAVIASDPREGLDLARRSAEKQGAVLVVGSMYLAAAARMSCLGIRAPLYPRVHSGSKESTEESSPWNT